MDAMGQFREEVMWSVTNALDASAPGQPVELSAWSRGERLSFTVRDCGQGMTAETLAHLGEPFFTTKEPGRGMGLGTFLARVFAENLHGSLEFESEAGEVIPPAQQTRR